LTTWNIGGNIIEVIAFDLHQATAANRLLAPVGCYSQQAATANRLLQQENIGGKQMLLAFCFLQAAAAIRLLAPVGCYSQQAARANRLLRQGNIGGNILWSSSLK
jgi:hypothetical protein